MIPLEKLGNRICIIGPSSSGKSTLAMKLGNKLEIEVFHLDQLAHYPNTNWKRRNDDDLRADHDVIIENRESWIIEGNYSFLMQKRFTKATSIIWLDMKPHETLIRYLKRSFVNSSDRPGNLKGATGQFSWEIIHYTVFQAPKNRQRYKMFIEESDAALVHITSFRMLKMYYRNWNLF